MAFDLESLKAEFLGSGGIGVTQDGKPTPRREGVGLVLDCPCGNSDEEHRLYVPFSNPLDGGEPIEKGWKRTGNTLDDLTLSPSIRRTTGCKWHGWIRDGKAVSC